MLFKIYGERNSGTNFLQELLEKNFGNVYVHTKNGKIFDYWKHGIPNPKLKEVYPGIVEVFIIRELDSWLLSMFKTPYHLKPFDNFKDFLTEKQELNEPDKLDYQTMKPINEMDNGKTIFEIRYYKIQKIFEYYTNYNNIVIVNLEHLQNNDNCINFLKALNKTFVHKKIKKYEIDFPHTKTHKKYKNQNYKIDINEYREIIDKYKCNYIEEKINNIFLIKN